VVILNERDMDGAACEAIAKISGDDNGKSPEHVTHRSKLRESDGADVTGLIS
jgi:hypothetical protein